jgi:hypothetical protein
MDKDITYGNVYQKREIHTDYTLLCFLKSLLQTTYYLGAMKEIIYSIHSLEVLQQQ